jgi:hypothetical protein
VRCLCSINAPNIQRGRPLSDLNYTPRNTDLDAGKIAIESAEVSFQDTARDGVFSIHDYVKSLDFGQVSLSKSHIGPRKGENDVLEAENLCKSPSITWRVGASILKTSRGSNGEKSGGGKRKQIKSFSSDARRRMLYSIGSILLDAPLPLFGTLTYPKEFPEPKEAKRDLKVLIQRMKREYPSIGGKWKLEPQKRTAPHFHFLLWGVELSPFAYWMASNWYEIAGHNDKDHLLFHMGMLKGSRPCVEEVRSWKGVWNYAAKYLGKTFEVSGWGDKWTGKYWGMFNRENIPFAEEVTQELTLQQVYEVQRLQRRKSKRKFVYHDGFTLFCNASPFVDALKRGGVIDKEK